MQAEARGYSAQERLDLAQAFKHWCACERGALTGTVTSACAGHRHLAGNKGQALHDHLLFYRRISGRLIAEEWRGPTSDLTLPPPPPESPPVPEAPETKQYHEFDYDDG